MPKKLIEKPYNNGTMSKSAFFAFIRSGLRQKSRWWKPLQQAKLLARRPSKSKTNARLKWEFKCTKCKKWFPDKETVVDHIIECGELNNFDDLPGFAERLFCEVDGFQVMCKPCHQDKTNKEREKRKQLKNK
jgi:hypothetical protein